MLRQKVQRGIARGLFLSGVGLAVYATQDYGLMAIAPTRIDETYVIAEKMQHYYSHLSWAIPMILYGAGNLVARRKLEKNEIISVEDTEPIEDVLDTMVEYPEFMHLLPTFSLLSIAHTAPELSTLDWVVMGTVFYAPMFMFTSLFKSLDQMRRPRIKNWIKAMKALPENENILHLHAYKDSNYYEHKMQLAFREGDYTDAAECARKASESIENPFSFRSLTKDIAYPATSILASWRLWKENNLERKIEMLLQRQMQGLSEGNEKSVVETAKELKDMPIGAELLVYESDLIEGLDFDLAMEIVEKASKEAVQNEDFMMTRLGESQNLVYMLASSKVLQEVFVLKGYSLLKYKSESRIEEEMDKEYRSLKIAKEKVPEFVYPRHIEHRPRFQLGDEDIWWQISRFEKGKTSTEILMEDPSEAISLAGDIGVMHSRLPVPECREERKIEERWKYIHGSNISDLEEVFKGSQEQYRMVANTDCVPDNSGKVRNKRVWFELPTIFNPTRPYKDLANLILASPIDLRDKWDRILEVYMLEKSVEGSFSENKHAFMMGIIERSIELAGAWSMPGRELRLGLRGLLFERAYQAYESLDHSRFRTSEKDLLKETLDTAINSVQ